VIVVLGGDGTNGRYARGLELLQAGYSGQLVLIEPNAADRKHALANVPGVLIWDDVVPGNSWGEAKVTRCPDAGQWLAHCAGGERPAPFAARGLRVVIQFLGYGFVLHPD
jgi:hypothetical protein